MQQLYRCGFSLGVIGDIFEVDDSTVWRYVHTKSKGNLANFVLYDLLPHLPWVGPPFPQGFSLNQEEMENLHRNRALKR